MQAQMPSSVVNPQRVDTLPQQGSTQPDDGQAVHAQQQPVEEQGQPSFKEQVIGYAQKTRGAVLRKSELKQHGEQVLEGRADAREPPPKH
ncbi:hypothetical protein K488DRAFT_51023 [Vararia minispora EC-137]|uniref:Uncharacterized protein n=1 Tax=Vararia minispora EC-137 TaxID=1314806 RepID=A0ACB8QJA5_9AGAM|nr:hypothetical protein K488DRAFT_51023 [Vararia minispora EC-137]